MRIARFRSGVSERYGVIEGETIRELAGDPFEEIRPTDKLIPLAEAELLPPCRPGKIIALGINYDDHAREFGRSLPEEPIIFMKPPTAVIGPGRPIVIPEGVGRVDYEAELALVVGRRSKNLLPEEALEALFGLTCLNDVTARDLQKKDGQWTRAKSFDTFAPVGPWISRGEPEAPRRIESLVNGRLKQSGTTADLVFGPREILVFVSAIMTLEPGDLIATGTPEGVGPLAAGDMVEVRIEGIGTLMNPVVAEGQTK